MFGETCFTTSFVVSFSASASVWPGPERVFSSRYTRASVCAFQVQHFYGYV